MTETAKYGVHRTIIKVVDLDMERFDWLIESDRSTFSLHDVGLETRSHLLEFFGSCLSNWIGGEAGSYVAPQDCARRR